jgi:hypothetical protein
MSHYAKVENGIVTEVIVADAYFITTLPGQYIQTSYNTRGGVHYSPETGEPDGGMPVRGNYAGVGYTYDAKNDVFYSPQPFPSWTISAPTWTWTPPVPMPSDAGTGEPPKLYAWSEEKKQWELIFNTPA